MLSHGRFAAAGGQFVAARMGEPEVKPDKMRLAGIVIVVIVVLVVAGWWLGFFAATPAPGP